MARTAIVLTAVILLGPRIGLSGDAAWPRFRGPTGFGYTTEQNLPVTWGGDDNKNVL